MSFSFQITMHVFPRVFRMSRLIPLLFYPQISAKINTMATGLKSLMYSNIEQIQFPPRIRLKSATQILQNIPLETGVGSGMKKIDQLTASIDYLMIFSSYPIDLIPFISSPMPTPA